MKHILLTLFLSASFVCGSQNVIEGRSVRVSDGDTFTLLDDSNTQHRIRLEGIDAPERGRALGINHGNTSPR